MRAPLLGAILIRSGSPSGGASALAMLSTICGPWRAPNLAGLAPFVLARRLTKVLHLFLNIRSVAIVIDLLCFSI